jgi:hypothetical protein
MKLPLYTGGANRRVARLTTVIKMYIYYLYDCLLLYIVSKQSSDYYIGVDFMEQSPSVKLQLIVGDIGYAFNNAIGIFSRYYTGSG